MTNTKPDLAQSIRALPEQLIQFETDCGSLLIAVELPKHPTDPYVTVRYDFLHNIPSLKQAQRN